MHESEKLALLIDRAGYYWKFFAQKYPELSSAKMPDIRIDGRLTKVWAYAYDTGIIRLSRIGINHNLTIYISDIIGHEICHSVQNHLMLYGDTSHHGIGWRTLMIECGLEPSETYSI